MTKTDLSGFVVTMHSGLCEQYVKSLGLMASGFDFPFCMRPRACDNKPLQNHSQSLKLYIHIHTIITDSIDCHMYMYTPAPTPDPFLESADRSSTSLPWEGLTPGQTGTICSSSPMALLIRSVGGLSKCFYQSLWLADLNADVIGQSINRCGVA